MSDETILIVDDEPDNSVVLNQTLSNGYRVCAATSGAWVLWVAGTDPRLYLIRLDELMPGMGGTGARKNQTGAQSALPK